MDIDKFTNKIIKGNSIDLMPKIPDKSIKLIVTDPPYFTTCQELLPKKIKCLDDYLSWYEERLWNLLKCTY